MAVYDHHVLADGNIAPDELVIEPVGSATTVLVERLRDVAAGALPQRADGSSDGAAGKGTAAVELSETEATLFALGIRDGHGGRTLGLLCTRRANRGHTLPPSHLDSAALRRRHGGAFVRRHDATRRVRPGVAHGDGLLTGLHRPIPR